MVGGEHRLPDVHCECGRPAVSATFTPDARGGAPAASGFDSCLRRCETCGIGFSNARTSDRGRLTIILRDPFQGLPGWVAEGSDAALDQCLNRTHRAGKRNQFHSLNSEDHITWTVLRLLQHEQALGRAFAKEREPDVLIWGAPVPVSNSGAERLRSDVVSALDQLGESSRSRTEPDVVLDFGRAGLFILEAKLFSENEECSPAYKGWTTYLDETAFRDPAAARATGRYQLVRNWRLGCELAAGRPFTLVNLAPAFSVSERRVLARLRVAFATSPVSRFRCRNWGSLLGAVTIPAWFRNYAMRRGLTPLP